MDKWKEGEYILQDIDLGMKFDGVSYFERISR